MKCKKIVSMCMTVLMLGSFAAAAHAEAEEPLPLVEEMLEELEEIEEVTEPEQPEEDTLSQETTPEEPAPAQDKTETAQNGGESANTNKKEAYKEARLARLETRKQKIQAAQVLRKQRVESRNEKIKLLTEIRKSIRSLEDKEQKAEMIQALKSIQKSFKEMNQAQRDTIRQELTQLRDKLLSLGA